MTDRAFFADLSDVPLLDPPPGGYGVCPGRGCSVRLIARIEREWGACRDHHRYFSTGRLEAEA